MNVVVEQQSSYVTRHDNGVRGKMCNDDEETKMMNEVELYPNAFSHRSCHRSFHVSRKPLHSRHSSLSSRTVLRGERQKHRLGSRRLGHEEEEGGSSCCCCCRQQCPQRFRGVDPHLTAATNDFDILFLLYPRNRLEGG